LLVQPSAIYYEISQNIFTQVIKPRTQKHPQFVYIQANYFNTSVPVILEIGVQYLILVFTFRVLVTDGVCPKHRKKYVT